MARSDDYRLLYDLMREPETVHLVTVGDDRYLTDTYALVHLNKLPNLRHYAMADTPDGVYTLRRTKPPQMHDRPRLSAQRTTKVLEGFGDSDDWRPVKATRWADIGAFRTRILTRFDATGVGPVGVSSDLWDRWHANLEDPHTRSELHAYQPDSRPTHVIRMDLAYEAGRTSTYSAIKAATTVGYIMPVRLDGVDEDAALFLCERFAVRDGVRHPTPSSRDSSG